jgi:NADPH-dependent curcumin reductase CurA
MTGNRQIIVRELPAGDLTVDHFEPRDGDMPTLEDGQVMLRTILMSIDAANRAWMQGATYREAVNAGDVMHTYAIGEVVESRHLGLAAGDIVAAESRWAEYVAVDGVMAKKLPDTRPLSNLLSVYGIAGKTAYHGLVQIGRPEAGETVVVSAAAGSVGGYVGQIAKALGCRVVGIAGGPEKCDFVTEQLGFDACVDYRASKWFKALKNACPNGIDIYFDNVGGPILETVLFGMNMRGRIVCCGAVSQYNASSPTGPRNLPGMLVVKRLRMEGFIVMDFADQDAEAEEALRKWVDEGKIAVFEDIVNGLENAPAALVGLLAGENRGKRMVRVAPDPVCQNG